MTSSKSKKRKSVTISAPIPCNTAFPSDHPASSKLSLPDTLTRTDTCSDTPSKSTGSTASEISDSESNSFDSDTPKRLSLCSEGEAVRSEAATENTTITITTDEMVHENGQDHSIQSSVSSEQGEEDENKSPASSEDPHVPEDTQHASADPNSESKILLGSEDKSAPVPAPRRPSISKNTEGDKKENTGEKKVVKGQKADYENPPGFLYKVKCLLLKGHCDVFNYL